MPILSSEISLFPEGLLDRPGLGAETEERWWALYSLPRREKQLMRKLRALEASFYTPLIAKRTRSPRGRVRVSHIPLFSGYVFLYGDSGRRHAAMTTNCVSRCLEVSDGVELTNDLRRIRRLIEMGQPLTAEARIEPGTLVRIRSGALLGLEGVVIRRAERDTIAGGGELPARGASVLLDDCQVEEIG